MFTREEQLAGIRNILEKLSSRMNLQLAVRLWDGSSVSLNSENAEPPYYVQISEPGVLGAILRRPTPENLLRLYATGKIDFGGGDFIDIGNAIRQGGGSRKQLREISKVGLLKDAFPFLFSRVKDDQLTHAYTADEVGRVETQRNNKDYIQFHYDVGNDFYQLFLDPEMQYSCGYFTDFTNSLEQAQRDKLEMICRKLRLKEGERMLDIGCGWGGLICYAAKNYGVRAHGITLSQEQHDWTVAKIKRLGLEDLVTVAICDYNDHVGQYDKISSIGMYEHIGIANIPNYLQKVRGMLRDRGIFLNHAIARRAKRTKRGAKKIRPERKLMLKYIFPGSELDDVGHTIQGLEHAGFEIHDVEGWREHYGQTCMYWCQRLSANKDEAIRLVGSERYRLWVAYLAAVSFGFKEGGMRIFQVVSSNHVAKGGSELPPSRADLYR